MLEGLNLYLIGMMGVGKTTVGKQLARELNYRFFDTDTVIEQVAQKSVNEIFTTEGENSFRQLESQVLSELSAYTRLCIATGGGIVQERLNWSYLQQGLIVWLDAPVELLVSRLATDSTRPLLQTPNPAERLQQLLDQRRSLYAEADLHIPVISSDTPEQLAKRVIEEIPTVLKKTKN